MTPGQRLLRIVETLRSVVQLRPLEIDRTARRLRGAASVADLRRIARRRLPRGVFDYIDGGAEDESTMAANMAAFANATFRPRVLRDVGEVNPASTLLGKPLAFPLVLAPTGFTRIADPEGELAVARAAQRANIPYTLSTLATRSIEEVRAVTDGRLWFQLYVWRDRALVEELVRRAAAADYEALVLTVDTAVLGKRDRDVRRGFSLPPKIGVGTFIDGAVHPRWTWDLITSEPIRFANITGGDASDGATPVSLAEYVNTQFDPRLSWRDVEWLRTIWAGSLLLKGIQTVEDAQQAAASGVDAIVLSNHGGRQLDHAPATFDLVRPVVESVGDRLEVICDGGVRRGSDIVKARAAGASACMAGRPYLYGLAAAGERGVDHVLKLLRDDVTRTMALVGASTVSDLGPDLLEPAR